MIAKIFNSRGGSGGAATIKYAFGQTEHKDEHAAEQCEFLTSNLLVIPDLNLRMELDETGKLEIGRVAASTADVSPVIDQFEEMASRNSRVQEPYWHAMLSFAEEDEGKVDNGMMRMMREMTKQFMSDMGFDDCAWVATVHRDTNHTHIHIAACTVQDLPGSPVVARWCDYDRAMESVRQIEADFGLKEVPMPDEGLKIDGRTDKTTANEIRQIVDLCVSETTAHTSNTGGDSSGQGPGEALEVFVEKLRDFGVDVQFQFKQGCATGISYSKDDRSWSGGKLGGGGRFTLPGLGKRGIVYNDSNHSFCERVTSESKERRDQGIVLTPSRFLDQSPGSAGKLPRSISTPAVDTYKHAEPNCLLKLDFDMSYAPRLNSLPTKPHYAEKKGNQVSAYYRVDVPRSVANRNNWYEMEALMKKLKKKLEEQELEEQIARKRSMALISRGLAPGQNPDFCTPRSGFIPAQASHTRDPAKVATGGLWI